MSDLTSKLKLKTAPTLISIGARVPLDTKQWLEQYVKSNNIRSVGNLLAALVEDFKEKNQ